GNAPNRWGNAPNRWENAPNLWGNAPNRWENAPEARNGLLKYLKSDRMNYLLCLTILKFYKKWVKTTSRVMTGIF
ncbi:MAG: hypothetical protein LBK58_11205, partial [Prevotellaceae bacterium]|nr:hypothetical protein [Prevotellaceae bacterium]